MGAAETIPMHDHWQILERMRDLTGGRMCERVIMMKEGLIVDDDTPAQLLARYGRSNMEEVFLDVARGTGIAEVTREAAQ